MSHLQEKLQLLKEGMIEMARLASSQLVKARKAYLNMDTEMAFEVIHNENRLNAMELSIDLQCKNILALFHLVATDLRFLIAVLKSNADLERIGDNACGIARYVIDYNNLPSSEILEKTHINEMFDVALSMVNDIETALIKEDNLLARKVFRKDARLNELNQNASIIISEYLKKHMDEARACLFLFSVIRKLERVGDHVKNIAEDLIFYLEAEVLKHNKKKQNN